MHFIRQTSLLRVLVGIVLWCTVFALVVLAT